MNIREIIKNNIQDIESQLNVDFLTMQTKPMVFIDNMSLHLTETPMAIAYLALFGADDMIVLNGEKNDALSIDNLIGANAVYVTWGNNNIDMVKSSLIEWGYPITDKTVFLDLKKEANKVYDNLIESFDDVREQISYSEDDMSEIFTTKESVMYSLYIDMVNNGYTNLDIEDTVENLVSESDMVSLETIYRGEEFRKSKSSIDFMANELGNLADFVSKMTMYNTEIKTYMESRLKDKSLTSAQRALLEEKAVVCRFKCDTYLYTSEMLKAYRLEDFESYRFYFKKLEMYTLMEDAFTLSSYECSDSGFSNFLYQLGDSFASTTATYAKTYLLKKNILAKLSK